MLTPQDVRAAQFEKNIRGYRTEEVDRFLTGYLSYTVLQRYKEKNNA